MNKIMLVIVLICFGCSRVQPVKERDFVAEDKVPGTVTEPWVEPMIDTVQVPAQVDPTGIYYRPSHQTVVEIRPGRAQPVQYPDSKSDTQPDQWQR